MATTPHILFVTRKYPPSVGGMQEYCRTLYSWLEKEYSITLVAWRRSQLWLPLYVIGAYCKLIVAILRAKRREQACILLAGDTLISLLIYPLAKLLNVRIVVLTYGLDVVYDSVIYQRGVLCLLRKVDGVVAISEYTKSLLLERNIQTKDSLVILHPEPPVQDFPRREKKEVREILARRLGIDPDAYWLLSIGRLVKRKGIAHFIHAILPQVLVRHSRCVFIVAGMGPQYDEIKKVSMNEEVRSHVVLLGEVNEETKHELYCAADVFVMPNIHVPHDPEGFGIVVVEANAYELPVVATDIEGIHDAIGFCAKGSALPLGDTKGFTDAIIGWCRGGESSTPITTSYESEREAFRMLITRLSSK